MKKILYWVVGIAIIIQFIRPDFKNPEVDDSIALHADPKVMGILKRSCYDCHSNETKYPWYHNLAPVSWVMSGHINDGRKALDFSNWANINTETKLKRLKRAKQLVNNELMPKSEYLLMHQDASLDKNAKEMLDKFFDSQMKKLYSL